MKRILMAALVLIAVAGVLCAQERIPVKNRMQKEFDRNRDGWLDPGEQEALEKFLQERRQKRGGGDIEELKRRIHELLEAAEEAKEAGRHDKAEALREEAENLKRKLHDMFGEKRPRRERPPVSPKEIEKLERKLEKLLDRAEEAEREGRRDEARELFKECEALLKKIDGLHKHLPKEKHKTEPFPPEIMEKIERAKQEIEKLHRMAEKAKEEGNIDRAHELLEKAERIEAEVREFLEKFRAEHRPEREKPHRKPEGMERLEKAKHEVEKLREAAHEAMEMGHHDKARALMSEAEALERRIAELMERHEYREKPGLPPELKEKIAGMKEEIEHLRDKAHEAKERGRHDRAEELWRESEQLEARLREILEKHHHAPGEKEGSPPEEVEKLKREIEKLVDMAERAEEAGHEDKARELWREAEKLEGRLREITRHREHPGERGDIKETLEDVRREREEIMREMEQMKRHLEELRKLEEKLKRELGKRDK